MSSILIPLTRGLYALADAGSDVANYEWFVHDTGRKLYAARKDGDKYVYMHREVLGCDGPDHVDHWNRDTLDNRKENLRIVSRTINQFNRNRDDYTNIDVRVRADGTEVYSVLMRIRGKRYGLGTFRTAWAARMLRDINVQRVLAHKPLVGINKGNDRSITRRFIEYDYTHGRSEGRNIPS